MSAAVVSGSAAGVSRRARRLARPLVALAVFAIILGTVLAVRTVVAQRHAADEAARAAAIRTVPTSAAIEDKWGIRFTAVNVLADGGVVEVRYIVVDPGKGARLHSGNLADLPYLRADDSGKEVHSYSLMFHAHFAHTPNDASGQTYSLIFGNSAGAAHIGGTVTMVLPDGLRLERVPVT